MGEARVPSLAKEGWTRHQENAAEGPFNGAAGVVRSTSDNRWREPTTPSAPAKAASQHSLHGAATPCILMSTMLPLINETAAPGGTVEKPSVVCEVFSKSAVGIRVFCGFPSAAAVSTGVPFLSFLVLFSFFDRATGSGGGPPISGMLKTSGSRDPD